MKKLVIVICLMLSGLSLLAENEGRMVSTSQTGGRYEIIQSNVARKMTFKLDKFTGDVFQYVMIDSKSNKYTWQKLDVLGKYNFDADTIISYQIFMGGFYASDCILLNIHTGVTYKLYEDSQTKELFFTKFF